MGYLVTTLVVLLDEIVILFVTHFLDVEGHGDVVEGVDFLGLEVGADVRKESLFIWEIPIILEMVVHLDEIRFRRDCSHFISQKFTLDSTILFNNT